MLPLDEGIKRWRASDVCLSVAYIGPKSRTERPRKTKIGTEVAHVIRESNTTFKVKGQGHQAALVDCSIHHISYLDANSLYATAQSPYTCMGGGILWRPPAQLVYFSGCPALLNLSIFTSQFTENCVYGSFTIKTCVNMEWRSITGTFIL